MVISACAWRDEHSAALLPQCSCTKLNKVAVRRICFSTGMSTQQILIDAAQCIPGWESPTILSTVSFPQFLCM